MAQRSSRFLPKSCACLPSFHRSNFSVPDNRALELGWKSPRFFDRDHFVRVLLTSRIKVVRHLKTEKHKQCALVVLYRCSVNSNNKTTYHCHQISVVYPFIFGINPTTPYRWRSAGSDDEKRNPTPRTRTTPKTNRDHECPSKFEMYPPTPYSMKA